MQYIKGSEFSFKNSVVTLGKFDGLHVGHRRIVEQAARFQASGYQFVVFTFSYHPNNLFSEQEMRMIYTEEEKRYLLEGLAPDVTIAYPFTTETAAMDPDDFVKGILIGRLDAKAIIVGEDFRYGYRREGDASRLRKLSDEYGYRLIVVDKEAYQGESVSSTRIRKALLAGNMRLANSMLGAPYRIRGEVAYGDQLGKRTFGMPTMNLIPPKEKLLPPNGVYASLTLVDGKEYRGVTNIGVKPTVQGLHTTMVETNLFYFDEDAYGKTIEVRIIDFIRRERKFPSMGALKAQMQTDKKKAKELLNSLN